MKKIIKSFILRGMLGAWGGPAILAIIWAIMCRKGILTDISISQAVQNVWSSMLLAFIAAGISVVHDSQRLPKPTAALIQCAVLYADYLLIYLFNGWLPSHKILAFTVIFLVSFLVIWLAIYLSIRYKVRKISQKLLKQE